MDLEFVNITHPDDIRDRSTRQKISRYVMRDIGRERRKDHALNKRKNSSGLLTPAPSVASEDTFDTPVPTKVLGRREQWSGHSPTDPYAAFPIDALSKNYAARAQCIYSYRMKREHRRRQAKLMHLTRANFPLCRMMRELGFTLAMIDDSAMYLALADSALFEIGRCQQPPLVENEHALRYYTRSLHLVNENMKNRETSPPVTVLLGIVIGIASYDVSVRNYRRWQMHMNGLCDLVKSQGGMEALDSEYIIRGALWTDIQGSVALDLPPLFQLPSFITNQMPDHALSPMLTKVFDRMQSWSPTFSLLPPVFASLGCMARVGAAKPPAQWLEDAEVVPVMMMAAQDALRMPRYSMGQSAEEIHSDDAEWAVYEATRLAAILFMVGPIRHMAGDHRFEVKHVARLRALLRLVLIDCSGMREVELWVLMLAAVVGEEADIEWLLMRIFGIMRSEKWSWEDAMNILRQIAWIDTMFPEPVSRVERRWRAYSSTAPG